MCSFSIPEKMIRREGGADREADDRRVDRHLGDRCRVTSSRASIRRGIFQRAPGILAIPSG
jgi:hypothetical protein